ncbi:oxygen-independent coproporphyrinogen III oxidase [Sediminitomix flava]|uniref:Coproporphyrinogen-III oxidase n=1 Tax=Sediminitomix flava TaxID=379075 RepID=A0A315Z827_SEDFL|nr:oxygen-independent coproporphyrinogen III oxidase [Sediminitomix flava]PWJ40201.1 oxygen-independent coproporphyrinogen-3 oxidase [Sediminitomix flava]
MLEKELIRKYNIPGPRYTSYPTVPYWDKTPPTVEDWKSQVKSAFDASNSKDGISIYIHLPYCESLCTYCGCNTRITINHKVEEVYIRTLLKEWDLYKSLFNGEKVRIKEIHLGGGTPTFFSPKNLKWMIESILEGNEKTEDAEFSFEAHPQNTTKEHLETLYNIGFKRLSLGIQDFDPKVQEIVNRVQSFEEVKEVTDYARELGYTSINYDLIYGLPLQTIETVRNTIELVNELKPDRIAYYSYAHIPWVKPGQRKFTEKDLPADEEKRALYELGKELFEKNGYVEIGMDHFALPSDTLAIATDQKKLHRNFMGYTHNYTQLMVGLGASSISDSWGAFIQNIKKVEDYKAAVDNGEFPFYRGHILNEEDLILRQHILNVMCHFETSWNEEELQSEVLDEVLPRLEEMLNDGLLEFKDKQIVVTPKGYPFVRNICMTFDGRMLRDKPTHQIFSQTV